MKFLVFLLLVLTQCEAKLWFQKQEENLQRARRRLTEVPDMPADVDAATGTVVGDPEPQEDKSCNGQLAQSLVESNEALAKTEQERDNAMETVKELETKLKDLQEELKRVEKVGKTTETKLEEVKAQFESDLKEAGEKSEEALKALEVAKDTEISRLKEQLESSQGDAERVLTDHLATVKEEAQSREQTLKAKLEEQEKETTKLLEATREEAKKVLLEEVTILKQKMKEIKEQSSAEVKKVEQSLKDLKQASEKMSKEKSEISDAQKAMEKELEHYHTIFQGRGYCNMTYIAEDISEKTRVALEVTKEKTNAALEVTKQKTAAALKATQEAATLAAVKTKDTAVYVAGEAHVYSRRIAQDASLQTKAGYEISKKVYNEQYNKQWPKIKPHYDQHVAPLVVSFFAWKASNIDPSLDVAKAEFTKIKTNEIDPRLQALNKERKRIFAAMVKGYASTCQESHSIATKFATEHDLVDQFSAFADAMQQSCQRPEHSVTLALKILLILCLLPFTSRIFGFAWSIVKFIVNVFLTVTLIKFILPGKSKAAKKPVKKTFSKQRKAAYAQ